MKAKKLLNYAVSLFSLSIIAYKIFSIYYFGNILTSLETKTNENSLELRAPPEDLKINKLLRKKQKQENKKNKLMKRIEKMKKNTKKTPEQEQKLNNLETELENVEKSIISFEKRMSNLHPNIKYTRVVHEIKKFPKVNKKYSIEIEKQILEI